MKRRIAHLLALVTASSTMLVGIPLLAASLSCVAWPTCSISAASPEYDPAGESRGESIEEEREEEVESKVSFLAQRPTTASACSASGRPSSVRPLVWPGRRLFCGRFAVLLLPEVSARAAARRRLVCCCQAEWL